MNRDLSGEHALIANDFAREREYWLDKLSGDWEKTFFPVDSKRTSPNQMEPKIETVTFRFPPELCSKLLLAMNGSDARLHMILTAGLIQLLNRYTGNEDIIVGTPIDKQEVEGEFVNSLLALRQPLNRDTTFRELLMQTRQTITAARENQNYPVETLPYELNIPFPENGDFPLFDVVLLLENIQDKGYLRDIHVNVVFSFFRTPDALEGVVDYNASLYHKTTIERIARHYIILLQESLANPDLKTAGFSLLSEPEKKQLLIDFNNTTADYPREHTIHELFQHQAAKTPDFTAVLEAESGRNMSYRQLNESAAKLAHLLMEKGVGPGTIVPIMGQRKIEIITGIFGILKAGGAYLPIDATSPPDRIKFLIRDSSAEVLLTQTHLIREHEETFQLLSPGHVIAVDRETVPPDKAAEPLAAAKSTDPVYVIYTSGTTGRPKGVVVSHRAAVNYLTWAAKFYVKNETVHFPVYSSISFDMTVTSLFTPLITGNTLVLYGGQYSQLAIEKILAENRVHILKLTPSHLQLLRDKDMEELRGSGIKQFIVGGEELDTQLAGDIAARFAGKIDIYNEYGPTEAAVGCMIHRFHPGKDNRKSVPIGVPVANTNIYLLDKNRNPVPVGITGEIHIAGDGIADGYLNRPELTNSKLQITNKEVPSGPILNAFGEKQKKGTGQKKTLSLYQTGDLARWLPDPAARGPHIIEFLGRIDHQVKIRGFRIEPGEIENRLLHYRDIKEALVLPKEDHNGDIYLCAYIAARSTEQGAGINITDLRESLAKELPDYMIPAFFVPLAEMPLTPNGKINRKALPEPERKAEETYAAPGTNTEEKLAEMWSELLGIEKELISIDANFFQSGGHSLNATVLAAKIHKECNVKVALVDIFEKFTIRKLAEHLESAVQEQYKGIEPLEEKEFYHVSYTQKQLWILDRLEEEMTAYNIIESYVFENLDRFAFERAVETIIKRHEVLRTVFITVNGEPKQKINGYESCGFKVDYKDLKETENPEESAGLLAGEEVNKAFDLEKGPLLRAKMLQVNQNKFIFIVVMHHIISDAWSLEVLINEIKTLYNAYANGRQSSLPPLEIQYKDFAAWQNKELSGKALESHQNYWRDQFSGEIPRLQLDTDFPRPRVKTFNGSSIPFQLDKETMEGFALINQAGGTSLFMILTAAVFTLLYRYTGQEDIIVGFPVSGREHHNLENQVGFYINILPLRTTFAGNESLERLLLKVKKTILQTLEHQIYPFEQLVAEVEVDRDMSRSPLFDVAVQSLNFQGVGTGEIENQMNGVAVGSQNIDFHSSKFDLVFDFHEIRDSVFGSIRYNTDLFKEETIAIMVEKLKLTCRGMALDSQVSLDDLDIEMDIEKEIKKDKDTFVFDFEQA